MSLHRRILNVEPLWNDPVSFTSALSLLPPSTHDRITRYHFAADRKLSLGNSLLQRTLIASHHGAFTSLTPITINKDRAGRPSFSYASSSPTAKTHVEDYNCTHHSPRESPEGEECLVACAARIVPAGTENPAHRIGVDIVPTHHGTRRDVAAFLDTFKGADTFTPYEVSTIMGQGTDALRARCLYLHWALKEAYTKAVGTGIVTDLLAIEFRGVEMFDQAADWEKGKKWVDARLWLKGVESREWYFEAVFREGVKVEGEGVYLVVVAAREGLQVGENGVCDGEWEDVDFGRDVVVPWGEELVTESF